MIIGLCGYAQVGKDTCARHLQGFTWVAFADALKKDADKMLWAIGIEPHWDYPAFKERWRPLLVALGAGRRSEAPNYWIFRLVREIGERGIDWSSDIAITDVRYANEAQWILDLTQFSARAIHTERPSHGSKRLVNRHLPEYGPTYVVRIQRPGYGPANEEERRSFQELERAFPDMPVVVNDGTPEELAAKVLAAIGLGGHSTQLKGKV